MALVSLQLHAVRGEVVEIGHRRVEPELGGLEGRSGDDLLHDGHVAVVDMGVGNDVDQLARLQAGDLGKEMDQGSVLHHVPAVGGEHVLGALM